MHDSESFTFPPIQSEQQWEPCKELLWNHAQAFETCISNLTIEEFEAPFAQAEYGSTYHNLYAMLHHIYYHLGQIVFIKKLLSN